MHKKIIGIFVCTLLIATTIPITGQITKSTISKDTDEINPLSNGDKWVKTYDCNIDDAAFSVQQTNDGGYIVVGKTDSSAWIIKTDSKGDVMWDKQFGGEGNARGHTVKQTSDGGYIIEGWIEGDIWLIKTDSNGNMVWNKTFGDSGWDFSEDVLQTSDGGYIIAGFKGISSDTVAWLIKTDEYGDLEWDSTLSGSSANVAFSVAQSLDGGYVITGYIVTSEETDDTDVWLIKTDSAGKLLWEKTFGVKDSSTGRHVINTNDGGYIITGAASSHRSFGNDVDVCLLKTDGDGELLWKKTFGGAYDEWGHEVHQTNDGGYVIIGTTGKFFGEDALLIKTNSDGEEEWSKTYGRRFGKDYTLSGQQTMDGGYILGGYIIGYGNSDFNNNDVWLIKTDSNGNVPRNKIATYNSLFLRFLEQFPILQTLLQRLGLQ